MPTAALFCVDWGLQQVTGTDICRRPAATTWAAAAAAQGQCARHQPELQARTTTGWPSSSSFTAVSSCQAGSAASIADAPSTKNSSRGSSRACRSCACCRLRCSACRSLPGRPWMTAAARACRNKGPRWSCQAGLPVRAECHLTCRAADLLQGAHTPAGAAHLEGRRGRAQGCMEHPGAARPSVLTLKLDLCAQTAELQGFLGADRLHESAVVKHDPREHGAELALHVVCCLTAALVPARQRPSLLAGASHAAVTGTWGSCCGSKGCTERAVGAREFQVRAEGGGAEPQVQRGRLVACERGVVGWGRSRGAHARPQAAAACLQSPRRPQTAGGTFPA